MAKVKKGSVSPKKRGTELCYWKDLFKEKDRERVMNLNKNILLSGRKANKDKKVEASTSQTEKRSRSKSNASKKVTSTVVDADVDSGISSPEKPRRTPTRKKRSSAASTISRISGKSKAIISKYRTTVSENIDLIPK